MIKIKIPSRSPLCELLSAVLALCCLYRPASVHSQALPASIEIVSNVFDFNRVAEGNVVTHDFEVKNVGGSDLIIHQVVPACGCTAAVVKESTVLPGASTTVHVEFDTTGFSGEKTKAARVNSNDPINPSVFISLKGIIESDISFTPPRIQLGEFVNAVDAEMPAVEVVGRAEGSSKIESVVAGSNSLEVITSKTSPEEYVFTVRPIVGSLLGDVRDRIIVTVNKSGEKREVSIPVIGKAIGPIVLKPSSVAMGLIEGESIIERRVQLDNRRKKLAAIRSIESDNQAVSVAQRVIKKGKNVVLVVSVDPKLVKEDLRATITLNFDDSNLSPVRFSVYGVVAKVVR